MRRKLFQRCLTACALLVIAAGLHSETAAAPAAALSSDLTVATGKRWVRSTTVAVGDGGFTPFTVPGVLTWHGGSIMGSFGITPGREFAQQTRELLGRPCGLYISATPGADLEPMIREAPEEIDRHLRDAADANVCVVQGGASDLKRGSSRVEEVLAALRRYCEGRRAAGFQVAVVTLLPRSDVPHFNEARNAYNARIRKQWPAFADAVIDIAADHRIGDDGDNLNAHYYRKDQTHPNAAGCAVMASIAAPVIDSLTWATDGLAVRIRTAPGTWSDWRPYEYSTTWDLGPGDGRKTVECDYRAPAGESATAADSVNLDTVRPTVASIAVAPVRAGDPVRVALRVDDSLPCARIAAVRIRVLRDGRMVRKPVRRVAIGARRVLTFGWNLPPGRYDLQIRARDAAGNPQVAVSEGVLRIR